MHDLLFRSMTVLFDAWQNLAIVGLLWRVTALERRTRTAERRARWQAIRGER